MQVCDVGADREWLSSVSRYVSSEAGVTDNAPRAGQVALAITVDHAEASIALDDETDEEEGEKDKDELEQLDEEDEDECAAV